MDIKRLIIVIFISIFSHSSLAIDATYSTLLKEYNDQYSELMVKQSSWPKEIQQSKQSILDTRSAYDLSLIHI